MNKLLLLKIHNWQKCSLACVYHWIYEAHSHGKNSLKTLYGLNETPYREG